MTDAELLELEEARAAATPGEWEAADGSESPAAVWSVAEGERLADCSDSERGPADARFVALAHAKLPALLAELRRARALLGDRVQDSDLALEAVRRDRESAGAMALRPDECAPCEHEDCDGQPAVTLACGRDLDPGGHPAVGLYCRAHAEAVKDEASPEYYTACPNCGCEFGVN